MPPGRRDGQSAPVALTERNCRPAYEHPDSVAALAGCTPVTKESGKHRAVHFRWACSRGSRRDHRVRTWRSPRHQSRSQETS